MPDRSSHEIPVTRGELRDLQIDGLGDGPDAMARIGGYVVFVPGALPGERVRVRITSASRKFGRGELIAVKRSAPDRVVAPCRHFLACGGCHRQHTDYPAQLASKQALVQKTIDRALGPRTIPVAPTIAAAAPYGQRHKVALHLYNGASGAIQPGFHRLRSTAFVPVHECPASEPHALALALHAVDLLRETRAPAFDPESAPDGLLRTVLVRRTTLGESHLVIVATRATIPGLDRILARLHEAGATTISTNHNDRQLAVLLGPHTVVRSGPPRIRERLLGVDYLLSPDAFFQTSPHAAAAIVRFALDWLAPRATDEVADLYCGGGLLTLPLARLAKRVRAVEANPAALADCRAAADAQGITNVTWHRSDVARELGAGLPAVDLVVADPPRSGLPDSVVTALAAMRPRRLVHIACDLGSLGRDLAALAAAGFAPRTVVPLDMFPQTSHVETLVGLDRPGP
ncbi:MAG: 23S rRNA (uracil(1939)-C(5))-methyltransferase RlmD [Planctomycetota bacterium]